MPDKTPAVDFACPYESCPYRAPTERQVRSHITHATHGPHDDVNGYTIGVDVPASNGQTHSYENTNKVQLGETRLEHITDEVPIAKQLILQTAYNNPDASYTEIHDLIRSERVEYSLSVVRSTIKHYVEQAPAQSNASDSPQAPSETTDESAESDPVDCPIVGINPMSATPFDDQSPNLDENGCPSTGGTTSESANSDQPSRSTDGPDQAAPAETSATDTPEIDTAFPYDVEAIPDYWSSKPTKIIAAHEALNAESRAEIHELLTQKHGMDISKSLVEKVLHGWGQETLSDLTDHEQRAINAIVDKDDTETLADIATRLDTSKGWLTFLKYIYPHIVVAEGGTVSERQTEYDLSNAPFDIDVTLDADAWTEMQRVIISAHQALDHSTDRELQTKLADIGIQVSKGQIQGTLSEYSGIDRRQNQLKAKEKTYDNLNDRQQTAVDILADAPPGANITNLADTVAETRRYLYDINDRFHHVVETRRE